MLKEQLNTGYYFDSHLGQYIGQEVCNLAASLGWNYEADAFTVDDFNPDTDIYHEAWDAAESYLQYLAPKGYAFGATESGDWGLWSIEP